MIVDKIEHLHRYSVPKTDTILKFIADHDCANLPDGENEIQGRELFVRIMSYIPRPAQENRFEMHLHYADVQYLVSGAEIMQTARMKDLTPLTDYDNKGDHLFFKASGATTDLIVQAGEFVVFYPNQAHRPSCSYDGHEGLVKKLVFKVKNIPYSLLDEPKLKSQGVKAMIRIAAAYPRQEGKKFDMDYYIHTHLPMVWRKFVPFGLKKMEVDKGIEKPGGGGSPFFAIGYLYFDSLADFQQCYASVGSEVVNNIPVYTDVVPMIQVGEIESPRF